MKALIWKRHAARNRSFKVCTDLIIYCGFLQPLFQPEFSDQIMCLKEVYFRAEVLPKALRWDLIGLHFRALEILVNNETFSPNVETVVILVAGFSFSELSKHGCLLVKNTILFVFFPITKGSPLSRRM